MDGPLNAIHFYVQFVRPVAQARSQQPPSRGGRRNREQILTDNFIVTQNNCKQVSMLFAKKRRNSVKSDAAARLFSNVR